VTPQGHNSGGRFVLRKGPYVHTVIIVNRHAGAMRRDPKLADRMREVCGRHASLYLTDDTDALRTVAEAAAAREARLVGVVGGDGTASATLTALERAYAGRPLPAIAMLRGGTMNTVATSLGITSREPAALLRRAIEASQDPARIRRAQPRPVMRIGDRLGFLFGTGVWYGYIAESYAGGQPTRLTNATVLGRALASAAVDGSTFERIRQPATLSIRHAGGDWETRTYLTVAAGTIADAGFGFRPFHRAFSTSDAFQLLAIKGSPLDVLRALPGVWFGRGLDGQTAYNALTSWAELRAEDGPFGYSVDGDVATSDGTLRLELGPLFRFLRI